jgi:DNA-binding NtrC family response regulator
MADTVLVVEDEELLRLCLCAHLERRGFATRGAANGHDALEAVRERRPDLVLMDTDMPMMDGLATMRLLREEHPTLPVVLMTAHARLDDAMKASRLGARALLTKPFALQDASDAAERVLREDRARHRPDLTNAPHDELRALVGETSAMRLVRETLARVAIADPPTLLVEGEPGTGKSLVAELVHQGGPRRDSPFVEVDCSAMSERDLEAALFGEWHGVDARRGAFENASNGVLVLDEVTHLSWALQARLLRTLETRRFRRDAGVVDVPLTCTVVATSRRNVRNEVRAGRFREDLYYRLSLVQIGLPALRERKDDLGLLVDAIVASLGKELHREVRALHPNALRALQEHAWPGNVRELRAVLERTLVLFGGSVVTLADLPPEVRVPLGVEDEAHPVELPQGGMDLGAMERGLVVQALTRARWSEPRAAQLLGIPVQELSERMARHGVERPPASVIPIERELLASGYGTSRRT